MERSEKVWNMVRRQLLERRSPPSTKVLYARAIHLDPSIRRLSLRQFNAKYPLQVKRLQRQREREEAEGRTDDGAPEGIGRRRGGGPPERPGASEGPDASEEPAARRGAAASRRSDTPGDPDGRDALREIFLEFGRDVALAEEPRELFHVLDAGLPRYVDRAMALTAPPGASGSSRGG